MWHGHGLLVCDRLKPSVSRRALTLIAVYLHAVCHACGSQLCSCTSAVPRALHRCATASKFLPFARVPATREERGTGTST